MKCASLTLMWAIAAVTMAQDDPVAQGKAEGHAAQEDDTFKVFPDPTGKTYFPRGKASYYTRYLSAMKEPSLLPDLAEGTHTVFRFTYLRSFDDPIAVRVTQRGDVFSALSVRLKMDRKHRPVEITHDRTFRVEPANLETVRDEFEKRDFWKPLTEDEQRLEGLDGSQWIFEIHDKDGYRMIDVWSPGRNPPDDILKQAGIEPASLRDFLTYRRVGIEILEQGGVLPKKEDSI